MNEDNDSPDEVDDSGAPESKEVNDWRIEGSEELVRSEEFRRFVAPLVQSMTESLRPHLKELSRSLADQNKEMFAPIVEEFNRSAAVWVNNLTEAWRPEMARLLKEMQPHFDDLSKWIEERLPPNWQGADLDVKKVEEIVSHDSIPIVWVPRSEIVSQLMQANTRVERVGILVKHRLEIADDCMAVLESIEREELLPQAEFARKAVATWRDGHDEAAQVFAACVTEALITKQLGGPGIAKRQAGSIDWENLSIGGLKLAAAIAPINHFYEPWRPEWNIGPLERLSRHNSVHWPSAEHCTPENCAIAVMLLCSLLRAFQERSNG